MRADPMSFSSILSSTAVDTPKATVNRAPVHKQSRRKSKTPNGDALTAVTLTPSHNAVRKAPRKSPASIKEEPVTTDPVRDQPKPKVSKATQPSKAAHTTSNKDIKEALQALADITAMDSGDVDFPGWADAKEQFLRVSHKRQLNVEDVEASKNKVCIYNCTDSVHHTDCKLPAPPSRQHNQDIEADGSFCQEG